MGFRRKALRCSYDRLSRNLKVMEVHFTPEPVVGLLEEDARLGAAVREGIARADHGEFLEGAEMEARPEPMLRCASGGRQPKQRISPK